MNHYISILSIVFCATIFAALAEQCPSIVTRRKWGGNRAKEVHYLITPIEYVIIHHTAGQKCNTKKTCSAIVRGIQSYHMNDLNFEDIGYNFLIGNDGNVYECNGWHYVGSHTIGYNTRSVSIAFMGNFDDELPSDKALRAAKQLLACGVTQNKLKSTYKLLAARQVSSTDSPGLELYDEIQDWKNWSSDV